MDEAAEVNGERFNEQVAPTTMKTGGSILVMGTTLPTADSLLYQTFKKDAIPNTRKIRISVEDVYKLMKIRSEAEAEQYWRRYQLEVSAHHINSDYIQSQYWVNFEITGTRFITMEKMQQLNVFQIPQLGMQRQINRMNLPKDTYYRIAAIDSARKSDLATFVAGILHIYHAEDGTIKYRTYATDFVEMNADERARGAILSPDDLASRSSNLCKQYRIDMLMYDVSGQQGDRAYALATLNKNRNINTMIVPYDYSGKNKETMFLYLEDSLHNNTAFLPFLENAETNIGYNEFLEELQIFKKEYSGNSIKYGAPDARGCHDDYVTAWAQLVYLGKYVEKCMGQNKTAGLAENMDYFIQFSRYDKLQEEDNFRSVLYYH